MINLKGTTTYIESYVNCCDDECDDLHNEAGFDSPDGFWIECELHGELEWFDIEEKHAWEEVAEIVDTHLKTMHFREDNEI